MRTPHPLVIIIDAIHFQPMALNYTTIDGGFSSSDALFKMILLATYARRCAVIQNLSVLHHAKGNDFNPGLPGVASSSSHQPMRGDYGCQLYSSERRGHHLIQLHAND